MKTDNGKLMPEAWKGKQKSNAIKEIKFGELDTYHVGWIFEGLIPKAM